MERTDARGHCRPHPPRGAGGGARRSSRAPLAPTLGARPHGGVPDLGVRRRRRRALGPRSARVRGAGASPARHVPGRDPRLRVDDDLRDNRGVPRRLRPVPRARVPGDQAPRLGRRPCGRHAVPARALTRGRGHRPDVRRLSRVRPARRGVSRRRAERGAIRLVRGADARVQRDRVQVARRARQGAAPRRRDVRRQPSQHRRLHRVRVRHVRPDERQPSRRHYRRDAHRTSRRLVPAPRRATRTDRACRSSVHGHPQLHLLRVARHVEPGARENRVGPDGYVQAPTEPGIALPDFVRERRAGSPS